MNKGDINMSENNFIGYEYQDVTVQHGVVSLYADGYENFGWKLENTAEPIGKVDSLVMKFKRDRKIRNKAELTRLQRQFETCVGQIQSLEASKRIKASAAAYVIGVIGTAFMTGSVFAVTANMTVLCIVLAVPAFIGWALPYLIFRQIEKKKTVEVAPLIDRKYEELYSVCEKANGLLEPAGV